MEEGRRDGLRRGGGWVEEGRRRDEERGEGRGREGEGEGGVRVGIRVYVFGLVLVVKAIVPRHAVNPFR